MNNKKVFFNYFKRITLVNLAIMLVFGIISFPPNELAAGGDDSEFTGQSIYTQNDDGSKNILTDKGLAFVDRLLKIDKDYKEVRAINNEMTSWLSWNGVLYGPVAYTPNNMQKYLRTNIYGNYYVGGVAFFNTYDGNDNRFFGNNLIYGHNMYNGTEFGLLALLKDKELFQNIEPLIVYDGELEEFYLFKPYTMFDVVDGIEFVEVKFDTEEDRFNYNKSLYNRSYNPVKDESMLDFKEDMLFLQTCIGHYGDNRYVVGLQKIETYTLEEIKESKEMGKKEEVLNENKNR